MNLISKKKRTNAEIAERLRELASPSKTLSRFDAKALKEIADQIASYPDLPDKPITEAYLNYHQNLSHVAGKRVAYEHCRNILQERSSAAFINRQDELAGALRMFADQIESHRAAVADEQQTIMNQGSPE